MREHHALGQPGGAARVGENGEVTVGVDLDGGRLGVLLDQLREGRDAIGLADDDELDVADLVRRFAGGVEEGRDGDQQLRPGVAQLVRKLARLVERVDGGVDRPDRADPVEDDRVLGQVRHEDPDHVAL